MITWSSAMYYSVSEMYACNTYVYITCASLQDDHIVYWMKEKREKEREREANRKRERERERKREGVRRSSIDWLEAWWNVAVILGVY